MMVHNAAYNPIKTAGLRYQNWATYNRSS